MKNWAGVWGIFFCLGVALWTYDHGEPWPAIATLFYTGVVAGHTAMEPPSVTEFCHSTHIEYFIFVTAQHMNLRLYIDPCDIFFLNLNLNI